MKSQKQGTKSTTTTRERAPLFHANLTSLKASPARAQVNKASDRAANVSQWIGGFPSVDKDGAIPCTFVLRLTPGTVALILKCCMKAGIQPEKLISHILDQGEDIVNLQGLEDAELKEALA